VSEWDYPVNQHLLPSVYADLLVRNPSIEISDQQYYELLGVRNFTQNLRINYKNKLHVHVSEKDLENLLDAKNALRSLGLEIVERQLEITPGNIIDLLCKDQQGDYVVVELKKHGANETIGQLARYVTDVREQRAKSGQRVKGLILALDVDEQLIRAARGVDFDVVLYQLAFG
jgi:RecB family endonuclease NucS